VHGGRRGEGFCLSDQKFGLHTDKVPTDGYITRVITDIIYTDVRADDEDRILMTRIFQGNKTVEHFPACYGRDPMAVTHCDERARGWAFRSGNT